jgi:RND superfamily putative drug exporter
LVITLPIIMSAMVKWTYPYVNDKMYKKSLANKDSAQNRRTQQPDTRVDNHTK